MSQTTFSLMKQLRHVTTVEPGLVRLARVDVLRAFIRKKSGFGGHTKFFICPSTKVYQLAAF